MTRASRPLLSYLLCFAGLGLLLLPLPSAAQPIVWSGLAFSFSIPNAADPDLEQFQDRISAGVWLTRGQFQGIYNARLETGYAPGSPADTEWAWDLAGANSGLEIAASNYANLTFRSWVAAHGRNPLQTPGRHGVLHLISEDIYLDIRFTSWQIGRGAGFAYQRAVPEPRFGVLLAFLAALSCSTRGAARAPRTGDPRGCSRRP